MILLIDNYDSFSYILLDNLRQSGANVEIVKNDELTVQQIADINPSAIVLSPGPGTPDDAGVTLEAIERFAGKIPLLGVCLGHQAIAQAFGAKIVQCFPPVHGKTALIQHDGKTLFNHLPLPLRVTRYHSLTIDPQTLPDEFDISATADPCIIMAIRHKTLAIEGVQFHPEAILTECGLAMLKQFIATYTNELI
ncbi:anthranilate synthase component II [Budvicia diplopodorum]|uniref:anthranilate synthase component II n=1 Tax=Budvicia diplopodorum TaxID=1119056 RepID=UPI0013569D4F|nr:aminodeoxychorismate/anthranilate synthase component II [Budvicia diplopodorum]